MAFELVKISELPAGGNLTGDELVEVVQDGVNKKVLASSFFVSGGTGKSAYEIAVENGFVGTPYEWILSLQGERGITGKSAYTIAVENGFVGDAAQWTIWLKGAAGENGTNGQDGTNGIDGVDGRSAYDVAVGQGFPGTEAEWLVSLKGADGANGADGTNGADGAAGTDGTDGVDGDSAYQVAVTGGFVGTEAQWLLSLKGADGANGADGVDGTNGVDGVDGTNGTNGQPGLKGDPGTTLTAIPYDITFAYYDTLEQNLLVGVVLLSRNIVLPQNLIGSLAVLETAPENGSAEFEIIRVRAGIQLSLGVITFNQNQFAGVITFPASISFQPGDLLKLVTKPDFDFTALGFVANLVGSYTLNP